MKKYVKPMLMLNDVLAEGVFAASGDEGNCMTVEVVYTDRKETLPDGREKFGALVKYDHIGYDHCSTGCDITVMFTCDVKLEEVTDGVQIVSGNGTSTIKFHVTNQLHAASSDPNHEKSDFSIVGTVATAADKAVIISSTTATITDVPYQDKNCPTHGHMYK